MPQIKQFIPESGVTPPTTGGVMTPMESAAQPWEQLKKSATGLEVQAARAIELNAHADEMARRSRNAVEKATLETQMLKDTADRVEKYSQRTDFQNFTGDYEKEQLQDFDRYVGMITDPDQRKLMAPEIQKHQALELIKIKAISRKKEVDDNYMRLAGQGGMADWYEQARSQPGLDAESIKALDDKFRESVLSMIGTGGLDKDKGLAVMNKVFVGGDLNRLEARIAADPTGYLTKYRRGINGETPKELEAEYPWLEAKDFKKADAFAYSEASRQRVVLHNAQIEEKQRATEDVYRSLNKALDENRIPSRADIPRAQYNRLNQVDPTKLHQILDQIDTQTERAQMKEDRAAEKARKEEERSTSKETWRSLMGDREALKNANLWELTATGQLLPADRNDLERHQKLIREGKDDGARYAKVKEITRAIESDFNKGVFGKVVNPNDRTEAQKQKADVISALQAWANDPKNKDQDPQAFYEAIMAPYRREYVSGFLDLIGVKQAPNPGKTLEKMKKEGTVTTPTTTAPTLEAWLPAAKKANPDATDAELTTYFNKKYGKK